MAKTTKSKLFELFDRASSVRPDSIEADGRVRYLNDIVTFDADNVDGDEIDLLPSIPKGALIDLSKSTIIGPAMSGVSVDIVDVADGISLNAAGTRVFAANNPNLIEWGGGDLKLAVAAGDPGASGQRISIAYYVR